MVVNGEARLVGEQDGKNFTVAKLMPGAFIGLTSLLRAAPCEEVNASTELIAIGIPDEVIIDLYNTNSYFKTWCNTNKQIADIYDIAQKLRDKNNSCKYEISQIISLLKHNSRRNVVASGYRVKEKKIRYI